MDNEPVYKWVKAIDKNVINNSINGQDIHLRVMGSPDTGFYRDDMGMYDCNLHGVKPLEEIEWLKEIKPVEDKQVLFSEYQKLYNNYADIVLKYEKLLEEIKPVPVADVKELTEVADLDAKINSYVQAFPTSSYKDTQALFFKAIDAINKSISKPVEVDNFNYPFLPEVDETEFRNKYTDIVCDRILNYDGSGKFGSEKLQQIANIVLKHKHEDSLLDEVMGASARALEERDTEILTLKEEIERLKATIAKYEQQVPV